MKQNLNLLIAIREKELRQKEFAEIVGIHPTTLSSAINGRINMSLDEKARCAKALANPLKRYSPCENKKSRAIAGAASVNRDQVFGGGCNWGNCRYANISQLLGVVQKC